jgi:L-arabinose transport system substrate-binding protein
MSTSVTSRRARAGGIAAGLVLLVAACTSGASSSPSAVPSTATAAPSNAPASASGSASKLAWMTKNLAKEPTFTLMAKTAKDWATKNGVDVTVQDLGDKGDAAITAIDTVIGTGVQGMVVTVPDTAIGPAVIDKAKAANVKLLALFDAIKDSGGTAAPFFGLDDLGFGKVAGGELATLYNASGWASNSSAKVRAATLTLDSIPACVDRVKGAQDAFIAAVPSFKADQVIPVPYKGDEQTATDAMATTITAHPEVTNWLIWSCNDNGVTGAIRALESAGVAADKAIGVGQGGDHACAEFGKATPTSFKGSTFADWPKATTDALDLVKASVTSGSALPAQTLISASVLNRDNYKSLLSC